MGKTKRNTVCISDIITELIDGDKKAIQAMDFSYVMGEHYTGVLL